MMLYKTDEYPIRLIKEPVPTEVQQACDKANTWLTSTSTWLVPYLAACSEGPDEWRLMLQDKRGNELCRHLRPESVDGHTMMLLVKTMERYGKQCHELGKVDAVNKIAAHFKDVVLK